MLQRSLEGIVTSPQVVTEFGPVRGYTDQGIAAFKGIPYGTPYRRFRPADRPQPWNEARDCTAWGPAAAQSWPPSGHGFFPSAPASVLPSEACLTLNVWTPGLDDQRRPVLVYIHGGGYSGWSSNYDVHDGVRLARRGDVVVVTVNHRLNGFGYLFLDDLDPEFLGSGNVGQLDLIHALQWVRDHALRFGGDPRCVTIFGQSGGGAKCATLLAMPAARGLFHRVWTMSGQQLTGRTRAHGTETARAVLDRLGVDPHHLDDLDLVPMDRLVAAFEGQSWTPVVDGVHLPRDPFDPEASPEGQGVPLVMGNTLQETTMLIGGSDPTTFDLTWDQWPTKFARAVKPFLGTLDPVAILALYRSWYPAATPSDLFFAATTAARSWRGFLLQSDRRSQQPGTPTWVYYLNWGSPVAGGRWRAAHTLDIPLVFDNVDLGSSMTGGGVDAQRVASLMADSLIALARTGSPQTPNLPPWPTYRLPDRPALQFDVEPSVVFDQRASERRLFEAIPYIQPGT